MNDAPSDAPEGVTPTRPVSEVGWSTPPPASESVEKDAPESVCSDCGMPGQCAACYLMATRGIPTPPRVIPPGGGKP